MISSKDVKKYKSEIPFHKARFIMEKQKDILFLSPKALYNYIKEREFKSVSITKHIQYKEFFNEVYENFLTLRLTTDKISGEIKFYIEPVILTGSA